MSTSKRRVVKKRTSKRKRVKTAHHDERAKTLDKVTWYGYSMQALAIILFLFRFTSGSMVESEGVPAWIVNLGCVALLLAFASQLRIYIPQFIAKVLGSDFGLITTDFFRFTRHPMYTFLFIWDVLMNVMYQPLTIGRIALAVAFYASMLVAGYFHEQEVLARFGAAAEDYYKRTPRFFFLYPFMRR